MHTCTIFHVDSFNHFCAGDHGCSDLCLPSTSVNHYSCVCATGLTTTGLGDNTCRNSKHTYMHFATHTYTHTHTHTHTHSHMHTQHTHSHTHTHTHTHSHMHTQHTHSHTHMHTQLTHTHTHTHTHTLTHTFTHAHTTHSLTHTHTLTHIHTCTHNTLTHTHTVPQVYILVAGRNSIRRISLDTAPDYSDVTLISGGTSIYALDFFKTGLREEGKVFWADKPGTQKPTTIYTASLNGTGTCQYTLSHTNTVICNLSP